MIEQTQKLSRTKDFYDQIADVHNLSFKINGYRQSIEKYLMAKQLPLPENFRVLDAGCGTGAMTEELARRGAEVVAIDISPALVEIAAKRLPEGLAPQVTFTSGDMLSADLGSFDHVMAMDSMIYYE
nr:methyltransferase domain-containing protein [Pyrinomonadaceae bacterium]